MRRNALLHVPRRSIGCVESISICWLLTILHNHTQNMQTPVITDTDMVGKRSDKASQMSAFLPRGTCTRCHRSLCTLFGSGMLEVAGLRGLQHPLLARSYYWQHKFTIWFFFNIHILFYSFKKKFFCSIIAAMFYVLILWCAKCCSTAPHDVV